MGVLRNLYEKLLTNYNDLYYLILNGINYKYVKTQQIINELLLTNYPIWSRNMPEWLIIYFTITNYSSRITERTF